MKHRIIIPIIAALMCGALHGQSLSSPAAVEQWVEQHFAKGVTPPFSFVYDGKSSDRFIGKWQYKAETLKVAAPDRKLRRYTYTDKRTGLTVACDVTTFSDFAAVDWVLRFNNTSNGNTPIIEQIEALNQRFTTKGGTGKYLAHWNRGSNVLKEDFYPIDSELSLQKTFRIEQTRGRSSDYSALPFFCIEQPDAQKGIIAAIGWSGTWYADILPENNSSLSLKAGMGKIYTSLYAKESMRSPRICLLFWEGKNRMTGHNLFRRLITTHYLRKIDGKRIEHPYFFNFPEDPAPCAVEGCKTAEGLIAYIHRCRQFGFKPEAFWLDAGWYRLDTPGEDGTWLHNIGNWTIDPVRFPQGLRPVTDAAHAIGAKFMLWFEPERVRPRSEMGLAHPEWLLSIPSRESRVFNLGDPDALHWLTEHLTDFFKREGIDYYRQDCNIDPLAYWTHNDKPRRIGMLQIKHIEGLYALWDSLIARFPHILIDNCASGGRRIDLETSMRSASYCDTDWNYKEANGRQCHTYGLNFYLPEHGTGTYNTDTYVLRSCMGASLAHVWTFGGSGSGSGDIADVERCVKTYKELRPFYYGDFYPLTGTKNFTSDAVWLAYQMNRPEEGDGFIMAFRRQDNTEPTIGVTPLGLIPDAHYELFYQDYGLRITRQGKELMDGLDITIPTPKSSLLIMYKLLN